MNPPKTTGNGVEGEFEEEFDQFEQTRKTAEKWGKTGFDSGWTWRSNTFLRRKGLFTATDRIQAGLCVLFVLLCVAVSLQTKLDPMVNASIYMLTAGMLIGFDPIGAFSVYLAKVTRYMILFVVLLVVSSLWIDNDNFRVLTMFTFLAVVIYTVFFNKRVLKSENWQYSKDIQHALNADPENESGEAWKYWGKVACRTLYGELGYSVDDSVVDSFAKPVFFLTYLKAKKNVRDMESEIEFLKSQKKEMQSTMNRMNEVMGGMQSDIETYKTLEFGDKVRDSKLDRLEKEIEELKAKNAMLMETNEYLISNPEQVVETIVKADDRYLFMTDEERVNELFSRGYRNKDIEKMFGKAPSTVSGWRKKYEETIKEA